MPALGTSLTSSVRCVKPWSFCPVCDEFPSFLCCFVFALQCSGAAVIIFSGWVRKRNPLSFLCRKPQLRDVHERLAGSTAAACSCSSCLKRAYPAPEPSVQCTRKPGGNKEAHILWFGLFILNVLSFADCCSNELHLFSLLSSICQSLKVRHCPWEASFKVFKREACDHRLLFSSKL